MRVVVREGQSRASGCGRGSNGTDQSGSAVEASGTGADDAFREAESEAGARRQPVSRDATTRAVGAGRTAPHRSEFVRNRWNQRACGTGGSPAPRSGRRLAEAISAVRVI